MIALPIHVPISAGLLCAFLVSMTAQAIPLYTEDFDAEISVKGRHHQAQTGLPIKHGYDAMPGWTRLGKTPWVRL